MAYPASLEFQRPPSQLSIDRKPSFFDDFEPVDSAMISPANADRRDSFTNSSAPIFSPAQSSLWDEDFPNSATSTAALPERQFTGVPLNPFVEQSNNPFTRMDQSSFGHHHPSWPMFDRTSESRTPVAAVTYEPYTGDFDAAPAAAFAPVASAAPAFGGMSVQGNVRPSSVFPPAPTPVPMSATSPTHDKGWMAMAQQDVESSRPPLPKRLRHDSPPRSFSPFQHRNGIKKKSQRFEIPPERSLNNIDQLIQQCTNEEEMKELKQQKRLLRNRQAALDSRQRKKKQYEDAQEEKKQCAERVSILEEELQRLTIALESERVERQNAIRESAELRSQLEEQTWNMENIVREHTLETGELRKKNAILTEKINEMSANPMPSQAASHEFNDFTNDMDALTMGNDWDEYTFVNDFCMGPDAAQPPHQKPVETTLVVAPRKKDLVSDDDKPVASGLLLMLLLCGAFVASKSSGSSAPTIPRMPDDVRAASAVVLDTVLKDAGVAPSQSQPQPSNIVNAVEPGPSGSAWPRANNVVTTNIAPAASSSTLDSLSQALIQPTKEQEAEATFSLSTAQYMSLTTADFSRSTSDGDGISPLTPESSHSAGTHRRNLAETLRAMREQAKDESAADVYTRSLLWDSIPTDVVKEFKRMVEESNRLEAESGGGSEMAVGA